MNRLALTLLMLLFSANCFAQQTTTKASEFYLKGRYEEAFDTFATGNDEASVVGQAKCLAAQGKTNESILRLKTHIQNSTSVGAKLYAALAGYYFSLGNYELTEKHVEAALGLQPKLPHAEYLRAELLRVSGKIEEAKKTYGALAKTPVGDLSADDAIWIGRAMTIHGRWTRDSKVFDRLVNDFYPSLLAKNEHYWPAHLESGLLFLEKYNDADATRELNAALAINPRAAEVHTALGRLALQGFEIEKAIASVERALKINPKLVPALLLTADIAFTNLQPRSAVEPLHQARSVNPYYEETLGRLLAVYLRRDGFESVTQQNSKAATLIEKVKARNPRCGSFYAATAKAFNGLRYYPLAGNYYKLAIERSPELVSTRGALGLVQMRLGEETAARKTLEESFKIDPFNARVKNTLDVLDLLDTYAVLETEHFILRFDRGHDGLLAEYAARFLEDEVYPGIVAALGYEPKEKTLLEIFSKANGTSGHAWFSARMVGLPFIGTVGACAGKMFALTSPADGKPYNWARVLRHEFVHVVNLQQTNFLIPHWFTEAIAVRNEMVSYPGDWDRILAKYVTEEKLFTLDNVNHGFVRPGSSERWTLAYFQSYLYADYIVELAGEDSLLTMLKHYAEGKTTAEAIELTTGKTLVEFEKEYRNHLLERTKGFGATQLTRSTSSLEELEESLEASRDESQRAVTLSQIAAARLASGKTRAARSDANKALKIDPNQPLGNYVMARLMTSIGEDEKAWEYIEAGLKASETDSKLLAFAANLRLVNKEYDEAAEYYRRGQKAFPHDFSWTRGLARVLLSSNADAELTKVLEEIADREADKTPYARKLTLMALKAKDFASAEKWANRVLHVDVMNPIAHAQLGEAFVGQGKTELAIREYETALKLSPGEPSWKKSLQLLQEGNTK